MKERTLIMVGSPSRSGSTMLDLMLGNAEDAISLGEVYAYFRPWAEAHKQPVCACGKAPCPVQQTLMRGRERKLHKRAFEKLGNTIVVDSSKELGWMQDANRWAKRRGYRVINVLIYKEPKSLAYSHFKRGKEHQHWKNHWVYYRDFFATDLPFLSINYNELVSNLPHSLQQLCQAIGIPWFEGKESFWNKEQHHFFGSGGVRKVLADPAPSIRPSERFSPEFEQVMHEVDELLEARPEFQEWLDRLRQKDVLLQNAAG